MEPVSESIDLEGFSSAGLTNLLRPSPGAVEDDLVPGTRLGDVTITRFVAEGGMGRVYEGLQGMPCRTVAVKAIRAGALSRSALKRFEHEAHILGRLVHPSIARIYSVGVQQMQGREVPYFVMEYVDDARSITAFADERSLSARDRVTLFREVCRAVAHAHQRGVIHRDLKPGNILVDASGQPKVIDFGVARSTDHDVALTTMLTDAGQLIGTVQYMCPEQFDGAPDDIDVRADVYALGMVLYELLAGRLPYDFEKRPVYEIARIVKEVEPTSLSTTNRRLPRDLNTIVTKCLEKDRGRRYSSATELEADLGRYLRGEPIAASPPRLIDSVVRLARRHRLAATAAVAILTALIVAGVGVSIFAVQAARDRAVAMREKARADAEADSSRQRLYIANLRSLQTSLEAKNLRLARRLYEENRSLVGDPLPMEMRLLGGGLDDAFVVRECGDTPVQAVTYRADGEILAASAVLLHGLPNGHVAKQSLYNRPNAFLEARHFEPFFFSVGRRQAYERLDVVDEQTIRWWRGRSDPVGSLAEALDDAFVPLAVSPDGRRAAAHAPDGSVHVIDPSTGRNEATLDEHRGRVHIIALSPDGLRLALQGTNSPLALYDALTGKRIAACGASDTVAQSVRFSPDGSRIAVHSGRNVLAVYDASDGRHVFTVPKPWKMIPFQALHEFTADGRRLVANYDEHDLRVWDASDGTLLGHLEGHAAVVTAVAFSADGEQVASGAADGTIRLWNARACAFEHEVEGHDGAVLSLAFEPAGDGLASGSQDGTVRIWSRSIAEPLSVLPGHRGMISVAYRPDGRQLAVAPHKGRDVELWDSRTVEKGCTLAVPDGEVIHVAYNPDGALVAAACQTSQQRGEVRVYSAETGEHISTCGRDAHGLERVMFSPDGSRVLTATEDGRLIVWDARTGIPVMTASTPAPRSMEVGGVFGMQGARVACWMPHLFDGRTGDVVAAMPPQGRVSCLAASPDGRVLATGMAIGSVHLVEFATGNRFATLLGHSEGVRTIAFDADGTRIVTGSADGSARLWNAMTGEQLMQFNGHEGVIEVVIISPDGRRVVTSAMDGTVRIWDAASGQELCLFPGQREFPRAIALHPDGTQLVTAASDGPIRIWGLSNAAVVTARREVTSAP